jgi:hypothetical protein
MAADNGEILTTPVLPTGESSPASLPSTYLMKHTTIISKKSLKTNNNFK